MPFGVQMEVKQAPYFQVIKNISFIYNDARMDGDSMKEVAAAFDGRY